MSPAGLDADRPVFIIGGSRTGSEMLKTMLSASQSLDFVDELFLLCPWWLHTDLQTTLQRKLGQLDRDTPVDELLDVLFSGEPYGWIWSVANEQLDREMLKKKLEGKVPDLKNLFLALMIVHAEMRGKGRIGAKFPMHYGRTDILLEWFPDCRLVHTTRDPRAVYASQANKYVGEAKGPIQRAWQRAQQFVHISIQVAWTARIHQRYRDLPNYTLVRYEDLVLDPKAELERICEYLNVSFSDDMLTPERYGSSFTPDRKKYGISRRSLDRWRSMLHPLTDLYFRTVLKTSARHLGYRLSI